MTTDDISPRRSWDSEQMSRQEGVPWQISRLGAVSYFLWELLSQGCCVFTWGLLIQKWEARGWTIGWEVILSSPVYLWGFPTHCLWGSCFDSVFSFVVVVQSPSRDSLQPHQLQHTRPPCPAPSPRVFPSSCSLHLWCHPAISSSDTLFFCPQSFPTSGTLQMSHLFTSDHQNTGASATCLTPDCQYC